MNAVVGSDAPIVRAMTRADVAIVERIEKQSYPFPWSVGIFRDCMLAGYLCRVLDNDTGLIGYAIMTVAAGEAHVLNLCIAAGHRRSGLARVLLESLLAEAHAAGAERVFLEVRPDNTAARRLYAASGFAQIGIRSNYYPTEQGRGDALVLARALVNSD